MRRVLFSVAPDEVDEALDGLLPILVRGIRERPGGHLVADGTSLSREELQAAAGRRFGTWAEQELEGLAGDEDPVVEIGGRIVVRAPDQPAPAPGKIDVVIERRGQAFGSGAHPTTRLCLELMLDLQPRHGLADLGCGLGTLAIAGSKLGWTSIVGVDRDVGSVEQAIDNARLNDVEIDLAVADLLETDIPYRPTLLVNAPPDVHHRVAEGLGDEVRDVIASSFMAEELEPVADDYLSRGFQLVRTAEEGGWVALLLSRDGIAGRITAAQPAAATGERAPERRKYTPLPVETLLNPSRVMDGGAAFGQLAARVGERDLAVSAARLLERGTRGCVLLVPGLFRFDLMPGRESFSVSLRELCGVPMRWEADPETVDGFRKGTKEPMVFRGAVSLPDGRLSMGLQALSAADEDLGAVHIVATCAIRRV